MSQVLKTGVWGVNVGLRGVREGGEMLCEKQKKRSVVAEERG